MAAVMTGEKPTRRSRRVLFVNHVNGWGGAEKSLLRLLENLDRRRFCPLMAVPGTGPLSEAVRALEIPVFEVPLGSMQRRGGVVKMVRQARMTGRSGAVLQQLV